MTGQETCADRNLRRPRSVVQVTAKSSTRGRGMTAGRVARARCEALCVVVVWAGLVLAGDLVLPVAARNQGLAGTVWRTSIALAAGDGVGGAVSVE